jgi:hypothetical protein
MKGSEQVKRKQSFYDPEMESRLSVQGYDDEGRSLFEHSFL